MLVYEVPDNDGQQSDIAYRFLQEPHEMEAFAKMSIYRRTLAAYCLGALVDKAITFEEAGRLTDAISSDEDAIRNRDRSTYERVIQYATSGGNSPMMWRADHLLAELGLPDEQRIDLGDDEKWVTSDGLQAHRPYEHPRNRLVASNFGELSDYQHAARYAPTVQQAIGELGLTHWSTQYAIKGEGNNQTCLGEHPSLGVLNEEGEFEPFVTLLD